MVDVQAVEKAAEQDVQENLEKLVREGAYLKSQIDRHTDRLREINQALVGHAEFPPDKHTGYLTAAGFRVKIQKRDNVTWDQDRLLQLQAHMGAKFLEVFKAKYEPVSKKSLDAFLAYGDSSLADGIRWAMTVKPGAPAVSYESIMEDQ